MPHHRKTRIWITSMSCAAKPIGKPRTTCTAKSTKREDLGGGLAISYGFSECSLPLTTQRPWSSTRRFIAAMVAIR